jgi:hypothetical protein
VQLRCRLLELFGGFLDCFALVNRFDFAGKAGDQVGLEPVRDPRAAPRRRVALSPLRRDEVTSHSDYHETGLL